MAMDHVTPVLPPDPVEAESSTATKSAVTLRVSWSSALPRPCFAHEDTVYRSPAAWRWMQRSAAGLALAAVAPLLVIVCAAVKATSPGPAIFRQTRRGFMGRPFRIYKIRTMRPTTRAQIGVGDGDPRVTWLGGWLRRLKIDELPQLWNVMRGDMELVGPRPIPHDLEDRVREAVPSFRTRYSCLPGLTSTAQLHAQDEATDGLLVEDWIRRYGLERGDHRRRSLRFDLLLVTRTLIFLGHRALGR